jgi:hypothetical protein
MGKALQEGGPIGGVIESVGHVKDEAVEKLHGKIKGFFRDKTRY